MTVKAVFGRESRFVGAPAVLAGCAALLLVLSVARGVTGGGLAASVFPVLLALAEAVTAFLLGREWSYARVAALALLFLTALLYVVMLGGGAQWWLRVLSLLGLIASGWSAWLISRAGVVTDGSRPRS